MKTDEFLALLGAHPEKNLVFEYAEGRRVAPYYHITEVKNVTLDTVDCGGGTDYWKETVVQLWENPLEKLTLKNLTASKALDILNKVNGIKPMDGSSEIKFEYGNSSFHAAQLPVSGHQVQDNNLVIKLKSEKTDCKAKDACGIEQVTDALEACCAPGSGCC